MRTTDFAKMLELGLGRAVFFAREHDMTPFRDMILNACLHCQSYDAQLDGTRGVYMSEIINSTPDMAFYREGILGRWPPPQSLRPNPPIWHSTAKAF